MFDIVTQTRRFDPQSADQAEWVALNAFQNCLRAESWPEDPPRSLEETQNELRQIPPFVELHLWTVPHPEGDGLIASANAVILHTEDNRHLAQGNIGVHPAHRRRGLGKVLLGKIVAAAQAADRRLLIGNTDSKAPAGEAFMRRLGARPGLAAVTNQLDLAALDRALLRRWQEAARERAADYALGWWDGPYPEGELEAIAEMKQVMNSAPRDALEVEDFRWTAEQVRQLDAYCVQRGLERWTLYARHRPSGKIAGYTEVTWNPRQPETLEQGDTGVLPEHRRRGLGRWLKAAMLERVLRERPQVQRVRTGNAGSNAPMLKINRELGFRPYKSQTVWQVELERVRAYLEAAQG